MAARTRAEAESLAGGQMIIALQTDWITVPAETQERILKEAESGPGHGFIQTYENLEGSPVLAVTYWKIEPAQEPVMTHREAGAQPDLEDETDDLYFKQRPSSRRKKGPDPNQLDLFS